MFQDFQTQLGDRTLLEHALRNAGSEGAVGLPRADLKRAGKVAARAEHGRWIVDCPAQDCSGAEYANPEGFFCCSCRNLAVKGALYVVVWPRERAAIEAVLAVRPRVNRNWFPGETLAALKAENAKADV